MKKLLILCVLVLISAFGFLSAERKMETIRHIDSDLDTIVNSKNVNSFSSHTNAYIKAQPQEFHNIVSKKQVALDHFLEKFAKGEENGLKEYIMAAACVEILGEKNPVKEWETGRGWYEKYIASNI
ncbi:hypothetical protein [Mesobacillus subterraneus]|uniref:Uncharacterized protein n=1 Tax=Mesobacillus subterraneus TaxID=285983 RepID=A0A3R9F2T3_9BACI|nr:hypothetical protein [Mesobacillus subterraneus]RSD27805.1 hypothetical protein EJA10_08500 [Mesobacillus subterraneus]